jgi:hypothetical protein
MTKAAVLFFLLVFPAGIFAGLEAADAKAPPWVTNLPIPKNEKLLVVVKGVFSSKAEAERLQKFIQQLMVSYPGDRVDATDAYQGLPKGKWLVGTLFDGKERAKWWMDYSYRNREISKGRIEEVVLIGESRLPYMPDAVRGGQKRLLTETEAIERVRVLPDVKKLAVAKKLRYKISDYPRNGDLRYEVEILEDRGRKDGVMVDFVMVSALNGDITERFGQSLGKPNFAQD